MIFDFACRDFIQSSDVALAFAGAGAVLALFAGLAATGRAVARRDSFLAEDIFVGWGLIAAFMTLAGIFAPHSLSFAACGVFVLILAAAGASVAKGYFTSRFWALALFPGLPALAAANLIGLGASAYDDFSHWVPNALYLYTHDGFPTRLEPSAHSLWPAYPYALPILTYLASLLSGGFLVQGGAMANIFLLLAFGAFWAQQTDTHPSARRMLVGFLLAMAANATLNTPIGLGITNQGDMGTMVLCAVIGVLLARLSRGTEARADVPSLVSLTSLGLAFVLLKQVNAVLLCWLGLGFFLLESFKGKAFAAARTLALSFSPAAALSLIWSIYAHREIGNAGFAWLPLSEWHTDWAAALAGGIVADTLWKPGYLFFSLGSIALGVYALRRKKAPWRDLAFIAAFVHIGYFLFLIAAFLGSGFTLAEVQLGASFHRYMLHGALLSLALFGQALPDVWPRRVVAANDEPRTKAAIAVGLALILPLIQIASPDWITMRPNEGMCHARSLAHRVAATLPRDGHLGILVSDNNGLVAFIADLEMALAEAQEDKPMRLAWHVDSYHRTAPPDLSAVADNLRAHPETDAILYAPPDKAYLDRAGLPDALGTGFLLRMPHGAWRETLPQGAP